MLSEQTVKMTEEQRAALQEQVARMTGEELEQFRNSLDPDKMGFAGEEGDPEAEDTEPAQAREEEEDSEDGNN